MFRGKRIDNGEWVYGYLLKGNLAYIVTDADMEYMVVSLTYNACMELVEVIPETVAQFTELKDKNGKMIFEGDIVEISGQRPYVVEFINGGFEPFVIKGWECEREADEYEIIGNIHDNKIEDFEDGC